MMAPVGSDPDTGPQIDLPSDEIVTSPDETPKKYPDPAQLAASVMLAAAIAAADLSLADLSGPGRICLVLTPDASWVSPVRKAWTADVSGEARTADATRGYDYYERCGTLIFPADESRVASRRSDEEERFGKAVAHRLRVVGISPDLTWLPADLVAAADHRLILSLLSPGGVADLARRVADSKPTLDIAADDAAAVTPRLARLAARPRQTADDYMIKLTTLIAADRLTTAAAVAAATVRSAVRDVPKLDRLHGMDDAVNWGLQLRDDLMAYRAGKRAWADVDRGLLLSGPPGTGKKVFARALAATCGVALINGSYGTWLSTGTGHQGDLLRAMRKAFKDAGEAAPSILFIDEVDAFADRAKVKHYSEWHTEVVNTLLAEIDGVEQREGVVVIAACNHPHKLDPALVRSGRLDRHIAIETPGPSALARILREHLGDDLPGLDLSGIGLLLLGATGADAEKLVRGARRRARTSKRPVRESDLVAEAGAEDRRSLADLRLCSIHEAGHAVAAIVLSLDLEGASIRDSSTQGGVVRTASRAAFLDAEDVHDRLVALLSGRAAEEVILGRVTSGAGGQTGSDLQRATWLAASAAAELGLDREHGLAWTPLPDRQAELFEAFAADARLAGLVRRRLAAAYDDALVIVRRSASTVQAVADELLDRGALSGKDVRSISGCIGDRPCA
jgi:hypothetical protein